MQISILAFGITAEIIGNKTVNIELPEGSSVSQLKHTLNETYPDFKLKTTFQVAINHSMASDDQKIESGDEVALIPPVSGG